MGFSSPQPGFLICFSPHKANMGFPEFKLLDFLPHKYNKGFIVVVQFSKAGLVLTLSCMSLFSCIAIDYTLYLCYVHSI